MIMSKEEMIAKIGSLEDALNQSKLSHKRIKDECRYIDYQKLQRRFFNKCNENKMLREALEECGMNSDSPRTILDIVEGVLNNGKD